MNAMRVLVVAFIAGTVLPAISPRSILGQAVLTQTKSLVPDSPPSPNKQSSGQADGHGPQIVELAAQNNSGKSGRASLEAVGPDKTRVIIKLNGSNPKTSYPADIYFGVCSDPGGVAYKLNNVQNGASTTDLPVSFSKLTGQGTYSRPYAISLSQSASNMGTILACGDFMGSE